MRIFIIVAVCLAAVSGLASEKSDQSLDQLEAKAEAARTEDRPSLYIEIAERQLKSTTAAYKESKTDDAQRDLRDVVLYAGKARDAAIQTGKKIKNIEIDVRKMGEKLRDIKRTVNFEDQAAIDSAIDELEKIRTDLLSHMFSKGGR